MQVIGLRTHSFSTFTSQRDRMIPQVLSACHCLLRTVFFSLFKNTWRLAKVLANGIQWHIRMLFAGSISFHNVVLKQEDKGRTCKLIPL